MSDTVVHIDITEWATAGPGTHPELADLRLPLDVDIQAAGGILAAQHMLAVSELRTGLRIDTTSYVGRVRFGPLDLIIRPKINGLPLWRLLRYAYGLRDLSTYAPLDFGVEEASFQELLVAQLLAETAEILSRGLHRRYVRCMDDLASPRGRIEMEEYTRHSNRPLTTLPCTHFPRSDDSLLNQALLAGLRVALGITGDRALAHGLHRHIKLLSESVSDIHLHRSLFPRVWAACNRLTRSYEPALRIIQLLVTGNGISFEQQAQTVSVDGFLFDMNRFFQTLVTRVLDEYLSEPPYQVESEYRLTGIISYDFRENPQHRNAPVLRPDILVRHRGTLVAVLDAKYRDLWENDLPAHMLYQLAIYALSQDQHWEAIILYPTLNAGARDQRIIIDRLAAGHTASVVLRPVNLLRLDALLCEKSQRGQDEIMRMAYDMVYSNQTER